MPKENLILMNKNTLRKKFKKIKISEKRKTEASQKAIQTLWPLFENHCRILSFASLKNEIDLWPLNDLLCQNEKLVLPKINQDNLIPCFVKDLEKLEKHSKFKVLEPTNPISKVKLEKIKLVLVPALAFDRRGYRLGYGKGYYDRFLKQLPQAYTIGVGLKENFSSEPLPIDKYDVPLNAVLFF